MKPQSDPSLGRYNKSSVLVAGFGIILIVALLIRYLSPEFATFSGNLSATLKQYLPPETRQLYWLVYETYVQWFPLAYLAIFAVLFLESIMPANREQAAFSAGFLQDFFWFNIDTAFRAAILPLFVGMVAAFFDRHLSFLTIQAIGSWPLLGQFIFSLLVYDFLLWFRHLMMHKVEYFWCFHAVHHSQKEMNLFTDNRVHFMEYLIAHILVVIPLSMLMVDPFVIVTFALVSSWHTHLYHANLKFNYGWLNYILVSPQSHRVHHSMDPAHANKNLGVIFSFWDRIFGTLHRENGIYPQTGIADKRFPVEQDRASGGLLTRFIRQNLYPFISIHEKMGKARDKSKNA